jgi:hypothetical protein
MRDQPWEPSYSGEPAKRASERLMGSSCHAKFMRLPSQIRWDEPIRGRRATQQHAGLSVH